MTYTHAEKAEFSQAARNQKTDTSVNRQFADNRSSAIAQRATQQHMHNSPIVQSKSIQLAEEDDVVKEMAPAQLVERTAADSPPAKTPNNTGLPDSLKSGIESLSGMSMDHVKVHYNSEKPAQLQAHAYAQGSDIHMAPGQEKHLPHEAWHVVQQAQGRVKPTMQMKGDVSVNDDAGLEQEADVMGEKAAQLKSSELKNTVPLRHFNFVNSGSYPLQGRFVHFHSAPPAAAPSDHTWVGKSVQVVGEVRPPFSQDTVDAVNARQGSMEEERGTAIRHINAWGTMTTDLINEVDGNRTLGAIAARLDASWPTTSTVGNPGQPAPIDNTSIGEYAEKWLDARHNDPANLFIGNGAENSALGDRYDNPTKAKGKSGGKAGSAFSREEKKLLVSEQITKLSMKKSGDTITDLDWSLAFGFWVASFIGGLELTHRQQLKACERRVDGTDFDKIVDILANEKVFTKLELTKIFRTPDKRTGAL